MKNIKKILGKIFKKRQNIDLFNGDIWTLEGKKLDGILPENYILYGELVGWTPDGKELQRDYTYSVPKGLCELYVYRIAIINEKGLTTDLSWSQVKEFCYKNGLKYVPELFTCKMSFLTNNDFKETKDFLDKRLFETYRQALFLGSNKDIVDEGVCIRADGLTPKILKAKSPKFFEHETKILDEGLIDMESEESNLTNLK